MHYLQTNKPILGVNYILQLNAFWDKVRSGNNDLKPTSIALYFTLLDINNRCGWKPAFKVDFSMAMDLSGVTKNTYYSCIDELVQKEFIQYQKGSKHTSATFKIIILYQILRIETGSQIPKIGTGQGIDRELTGNILKHINSKDKNNKQKEEPAELVVPIINYLNERANKNFKISSPETRQLIAALEKDGYIFDDFKKVIDTKCNQWLTDRKFNVYLRPETLFSNKFESYLNEQPAPSKIKKLIL